MPEVCFSGQPQRPCHPGQRPPETLRPVARDTRYCASSVAGEMTSRISILRNSTLRHRVLVPVSVRRGAGSIERDCFPMPSRPPSGSAALLFRRTHFENPRRSVRFDHRIHRHTPKVLSPQPAATPNNARKATPTARSTNALLLQAWSTAISQTKNSPIAPTATIFRNMGTPKVLQTKEDVPILLNCFGVRSDTNHGRRSVRLSRHYLEGLPESARSYPAHCSTGNRGYLGKLGSVADRWHM